jgi:hypothetical protein
MSNSYVLLEKVVVGSAGASSVTFSNIPQTGYTDLKIVMSCRNVTNTETVGAVYFNSDTTDANYSARRILGNGSSASSLSNANPYFFYMDTTGETASTFANCEMYIPNYTGSTAKSVSAESVTENNATAALAVMVAGLWTGTAAINAIQIRPYSAGGGNFAANSTFYLYGVAKLGTTPTIAPKATGGDVIDTDGTYWYHIFRSSGTFTPATALTCDYLVVAGGGGGGSHNSNLGGSSGGGAGGLRSTVTATGGGGSLETALSLGASAYTVTVGAGGAGAVGATADGSIGANSVFATITSTGGGIGRKYTGPKFVGGDGGSGGGGSGYSSAPTGVVNPGGAATPAGQGYAGGGGWYSGSVDPRGGGGGGAGAVGGTASDSAFGTGGNGVAVAITGTSVTYAGGGGGPGWTSDVAGGSGGGGTGKYNAIGVAGTANLGAGGGGGSAAGGGNGGSGIVVVRYLVA